MIFTLLDEGGNVRSIISVPDIDHAKDNMDADPLAVDFIPGPPPDNYAQWSGKKWKTPVEASERAKADKTHEMMQASAQARNNGFKVGEFTYACHDEAQQRLMMLLTMASADPEFTAPVVLADGSMYVLNAQQIKIAAVAMVKHLTSIDVILYELKQKIAKAKTLKKLNAISWP